MWRLDIRIAHTGNPSAARRSSACISNCRIRVFLSQKSSPRAESWSLCILLVVPIWGYGDTKRNLMRLGRCK
ncbi:hypothetical protein EJ08DRAFT_268365 [Tothia fuscella]|uniref:Uncharacterized protein n=1 Tax=Tothia fuscella TaxID=1048955 RepID=A0A9P4NQH6_9PEZI|nr:hypothetical protein EJ08DRAFT_268365 [Tothia fuscella]